MGKTETAFIAQLQKDGFDIQSSPRFPWLTNKGHHCGLLSGVDSQTIKSLRDTYLILGGNETLLQSKHSGTDPKPDCLIRGTRLIVEVDELQHFTTDRLKTFQYYPKDRKCAGWWESYPSLIQQWSTVADRYRFAKECRDFPFPGGRRAQRAYFDMLRDLLAPQFGYQLIRVAAPEYDVGLAVKRFYEELQTIELSEAEMHGVV